jgi:muramoyltetrapeptide carboxypeptidase
MAFSRKDFIKRTALIGTAGLTFGTVGCVSDPKMNAPVIPRKTKPKALKKGDTLGLVAPASPIYQSSEFDEMLVDLEALGFNLKLGEHVRDQRGYLAGTDENRAADFMRMFEDDSVDAIMCVRGGWGCNRILPLLDYEVIRQHPKLLCGFSDITSLHMALYTKSDLISFHGPVGKSVWTDFTVEAFQSITEHGNPSIFMIPDSSDDQFVINGARSRGRLLGGNLSVLSAMIGSDYVPTFNGAILFLEDVGESVYRIDRMLTQLKLAGILDQITGFVFGKCTDCSAGSNSLSMQQLLYDHIKPLGIPAFYGAMISHEEDNITLPVGVEAEIDADRQTIHVLESGVAV